MDETAPLRSEPGPPAPGPRPAYERVAGIHVVRVQGDDYEMGHQHGRLLAEAVRRGPVPYFDRYVERMLVAGLGRPLGALGAAALRHTVGRRIARGFPESAIQALDGLADGAGLDRAYVRRAVTMPETYLGMLGAFRALVRPGLAPRPGITWPAPLMGCTSALAWGDATRHGRMLHGRNLDYQGVGAWDTQQAVIFHRPRDGQPYVSITAAGVVMGGVTAMNASGLTLVVHQHIASDALELGGVPIGYTGDQVMRHAHSLDDARRILEADRPNGCWTYVIASAAERATLCFETTPRRQAHRIDDSGTFAYTNVYLDAELGRTEHHLYPPQWRNNLARLAGARSLLEARRGALDENAIAAILGHPGAGACRFEDAIAQLMTVASVVFDPERALVWVAAGRAPVSNRDYVAFDLGRESPRPDLAPLTGGRPSDRAARDAFDAYRDGYEAYFDRQDVPAARHHLARAAELAPGVALYPFIGALLALLDRDAAAAERGLDRALEIGHDEPERIASFHLWRGRARDALGRRVPALEDYRRAQTGGGRLARAARRGARRPWRPKRFGIEFALADVPMP
jgi:tetratricopeptide (TPR) repeat protein